MGHRYEISGADGDRVKGHLPGQPGQHGGAAEGNRRFITAVLRIARAGAAWEDLPERLGKGSSQWRRFDRWARAGRWDPILSALRDPDPGVLALDSTAARAHPRAAGAERSGAGPAASPSRPGARAGAGSGPRPAGASTASGTPSSCS